MLVWNWPYQALQPAKAYQPFPSSRTSKGNLMKTSKKCHRCGLVNFATDDLCRRCSEDLNSFAQVSASTPAPKSRSTLYVCLFSLALIGLGIWGYHYKRESDRELAQKAEFVRRQNDYAGHDINTIPPAGAPTPAPQISRIDQMKGYNEAMEKSKKDMQSYTDMIKSRDEVLKNVPVPTPLRPPDR